MFARIVNETTITYFNNPLRLGDLIITNPNEEQLNEANYYEVIDSFEMEEYTDPETGETYLREVPAKEFYHYENHYEKSENSENSENSEKIIHTHIEVKDSEPDRSKMIVEKIRKQYDVNAELAIQRQRSASPEKEADFEEYNTYCEQCKAEVDDYISRWREA